MYQENLRKKSKELFQVEGCPVFFRFRKVIIFNCATEKANKLFRSKSNIGIKSHEDLNKKITSTLTPRRKTAEKFWKVTTLQRKRSVRNNFETFDVVYSVALRLYTSRRRNQSVTL